MFEDVRSDPVTKDFTQYCKHNTVMAKGKKRSGKGVSQGGNLFNFYEIYSEILVPHNMVCFRTPEVLCMNRISPTTYV